MNADRAFSRAPRRMGIACVLTGPPVCVNITAHGIPFITYASSHDLLLRI
ncbi:hypothetical protein AWB80_06258 [Caballeronia pedi]|uniref:Uncharacterized protein n=1 Tax=Caballeronia pedi TaxID=1777141 RepID=A0A158D3M0_9BURK|nr:hypothetical protein AWB80_06258 [Caballeronia pedi]